MKAADVVFDQYRTELTLATMDELNVGGNGIARSAVILTKNELASSPLTNSYLIEKPPDDVYAEITSDTNCEKLCRNVKRGAKKKR